MGAAAIPIASSVAGAAASSALSKGKGGGGTTTSNEPWSGLQPYLRQLYEGASGLLEGSGGTYPYYPGSTVAERSPYTLAGAQAGLDRLGTAGIFGQGYGPASQLSEQLLSQYNPSLFGWSDLASGDFGPSTTGPGQAAYSSLMPTAMGGMLNANPYIDDMFRAAAGQVTDQYRTGVMPGIQSMFSAAGRYGPGASMSNAVDLANQGYGATLNRLAANTYGQNYANERQQQMQAAQQLGNLGTSDIEAQIRGLGGLQQAGQYDVQNQLQMLPFLLGNTNVDINQLLQIGQQQEAYNQQLINADQARWNYVTQQGSYLPLQQFGSLIGSINPGSGTTSVQNRPPMLDTLFGGAQLGAGIGQMFGGSSFGGTPFNYGGGSTYPSYGLNAFRSTPDFGGFGSFGGMGGSLYQ